MKVGFPDPKDLLAKKKAQKEAAKAAVAEKIARGKETQPLPVLESSPEPPVMPVQSPTNGASKGHPVSEKGDGHDESHGQQAKIKTLEDDNSALVTQIVDAYEKATLKAHYDLLKEYKQGLLVDADVEEEIELYEDSPAEAEESSSAPADVSAPTLNEPKPVSEPQSNVDPLEYFEKQQ
ncbi:hypothetical protein TIFTF001_040928 [Ficus carica]|uniref:Uncharacterized protein n=1 Tax=Ficus carica TaxID=3494 RepID=A0AA88D4Q1_FICCA|nr:hypothetical protein TIFTF001_040924 [Ficus carica]GMN26912.1 hypothetical protein TIFTF001_040928 [Ficus carica]